jgi:DNA polymerase-3 subunit gamma/tau
MLATTEPHKILPTVLSRCQQYHLGRISLADISARLREISAAEGVSVSDDALALVATAADGSMRDAQSLLDKLIAFAGDDVDDETVIDLLGLVDRSLLYEVVDLIAREDLNGVLGLVNNMVEQGVDLHQFTLDLLGHLRGLLVVRTVDDATSILHLPDVDIMRMREQAAAFEIEDVDRAFALLAASEYRIKQSEVPRYHLEMVLGRLARLPRLEPLADLIKELRGAPASGGGSPGSAAGGASSSSSGSPPPSAGSRASSEGSRAYGFDDRPLSESGSAAAAPAQATASALTSAQEPPPEPDPAPAPEPLPTPAPVPAPEPLPVPEPTPAPEPLAVPEPTSAPESPPPAPDPSFGPSPNEPASGVEFAPEAEPSSEPTTSTPGVDSKVELILQRLRDTKPMIAQVLARAESIEMKDERLLVSFPSNRSLFRDRLKDEGSLEAIEAAAKAAVGQSLRVSTAIATGDPAPGGEPAAPSEQAPPREPARRPEPTQPIAASVPSGAQEAARKKLWQRAEEEPLVKGFLEELGGQLTEVEEI